ncbi:hypothetical protein [Salibacterium sp. K-3]
MKQYSWMSYVVLAAALYPLPYIAQLFGITILQINFLGYDHMFSTLFLGAAGVVVLSAMIVVKKTERNIAAAAALILSVPGYGLLAYMWMVFH